MRAWGPRPQEEGARKETLVGTRHYEIAGMRAAKFTTTRGLLQAKTAGGSGPAQTPVHSSNLPCPCAEIYLSQLEHLRRWKRGSTSLFPCSTCTFTANQALPYNTPSSCRAARKHHLISVVCWASSIIMTHGSLNPCSKYFWLLLKAFKSVIAAKRPSQIALAPVPCQMFAPGLPFFSGSRAQHEHPKTSQCGFCEF